MLLFCTIVLSAQDSTKQLAHEDLMMSFYMVFLYRGEAWTAEKTPETENIQKGHLANIEKLAREGKIVLAGPFMDKSNLRGIFIFNAATQEEVEALCATDPAVKAKRLRIEIKPWYGPKSLLNVNKEYFNK